MPEADDGMRERLAATLRQKMSGLMWGRLHAGDLADALLPTVRAIVADELRAAANDAANSHVVALHDGRAYRMVPVAGLYARADALDPR